MAIRSLYLILLALETSNLVANPFDGQVLQVCGDGAGRPPYTFEVNGGVRGYDVDVLEAILTPLGVKFEVTMPPWKRCLRETETGNSYHVALSASYSGERDRSYMMTRDYYALHGYYFYSNTNHPNGLDIKLSRDLETFTVCGIRGYNYERFGLDATVVDRGAGDLKALIQKTKFGHCDVFLARYEILYGFSLIGQPYLDGTIGYKAVPKIEGENFYMLISREYLQSKELKAILDEGITRLKKNGELDKILQRYLN